MEKNIVVAWFRGSVGCLGLESGVMPGSHSFIGQCRYGLLVMGLTWGVWDATIFDLRPNIILGADVLYDSSAFDDLFATVSFLLQNSPDAVFITTYHNRSGHHLIEFLMVKWGLKCVKLVDGFSFLPSRKASLLSGNIQLAEIVMGLTWGVWDATIFDLRPNIILGADVLYDSSAFDDLFATVSFLLQNSPDAVFITTYHNRSGHHLIEFLMVKWGLKCVKLVDGFSFLPSRKASLLSGNIQLVEIVLSCGKSAA
ncbi:hypothetical protein F2Q69_00040825 [Brassica cretica]|uniref:Methyltransferase-like protein 23 n=1 Tax=Brassica cretica TaxID=69181 RepID=A0A8S9N9W9_BRACR|nr:hypothetical protein F2Q69_00040825 [Brassica cretica]